MQQRRGLAAQKGAALEEHPGKAAPTHPDGVLREEGLAQPAIGFAEHGQSRKALKPKPCGGRQRQNMTIAEEKALLTRFANVAGAGELLNIHDLKHAYEQAIGRCVIKIDPKHPHRIKRAAQTTGGQTFGS